MAITLLEQTAETENYGHMAEVVRKMQDEDVLWALNMTRAYLGHEHHSGLYHSEIIESAKRLDVTPAEFVEAYGEAVSRLNESRTATE